MDYSKCKNINSKNIKNLVRDTDLFNHNDSKEIFNIRTYAVVKCAKASWIDITLDLRHNIESPKAVITKTTEKYMNVFGDSFSSTVKKTLPIINPEEIRTELNAF